VGSTLIQNAENLLIGELRRLSPHQPLPSELQLAKQYGISRWTIRKAFAILEKKGLIRRFKRKGTFPAQGRHANPILRQQARMIGLIATNAFATQSQTRPIASGVFSEASQNGYILVVAKKEIRENIYQIIDCPLVDGLLLSEGVNDPRLICELAKRKKPICLLNQTSRIEKVDSVQMDLKGSAMLAVRHLYELGHRRIAFIHSSDSDWGPLRLRSYEMAMRKLRILQRPEWILEKSPTFEGGEEGAAELLSLPSSRRPTAIIISGNRSAHGVLKIILQCGLQIPQDMSVIGGSGSFPPSNKLPKLTRVTSKGQDLGKIAVQHLLDRLKNPNQPARNTLLPVTIQIKETTGKI
jgi:DNA-binding LacI/PurR family transcriptional regulator